MKHNSLIYNISSVLLILISGLMMIMNFHEYIKIGILERIDNYPFGGEGSVPYYYKTAKLYSFVMLVWGLLFLTNLTLGIVSIAKKKIKLTYLTLGLLMFLIIAQYLHGLID